MFKRLLFLAFLSGAGGLAYEVIYARLVSYYIGDIFYILFTVLVTVFLGLAFGYFFANKFVRYLWLVEIALGVYALASAYFFSTFSIKGLSTFSDFFSNDILLVIVSFIFIFIPMFLSGFSVPIFSRYISLDKQDKQKSFSIVYGLYALGSVLFIFLIEFLFIPSLGIVQTLYISSIISIFVGIVLFIQKNKLKIKENLLKKKVFILIPFVVGVLSTMFQYYYLELTFKFVGPSISNFSFTIASAILGISLGTFLFYKSKINYKKFLAFGSIIGALPFLFLTPLAYSWSHILNYFSSLDTSLNAIFIIIISLPMFIVFGAFIPIYARKKENGEIENILFCNALGNAFGIILAGIILFSWLELSSIIVIICILFLLLIIKNLKKTQILIHLIVPILLILFWPFIELDTGSIYVARDSNHLNDTRENVEIVTKIRSLGNETIIARNKIKDSYSLIHSGYTTLNFTKNNKTIYRQSALGIFSGIYENQLEKALVIGLGSGTAHSGIADIYEYTKVFEINPLMLDITKYFAKENRNLLDRSDIEIVIADGFLATALEKDNTYDFILGASSLPTYYSANKLFTEEYFEISKSKLKENGIFGIWYDGRYNQEAIDILFTTLSSVYNECDVYFLAGSYYVVFCSDNLKESNGENIDFKSNFSKMIFEKAKYLKLFSFSNGDYLIDSKINTLDNPLLLYDVKNRYFTPEIGRLHWDNTINKAIERGGKEVCDAMNFFSYIDC